MTRLHLFVALLLVATAAASGAEIPVGTPPLIGGSLEGLIFDGSHFVLTQSGMRTFLADDGAPLQSGLPAAEGENVALASSGRGYLSVSVSHGSAYATRLNERGQVIDTFLAAQQANAAALAWDGTRYVLAWRDDHRRIAVSFIGEGVNGTAGIANDADAFALAARNGVALVAWSSGGSLFARTISGQTFLIGNGALSDVAAGKDGFMVATIANGMLVARHLDLAGHPDASYTVAPSAGGVRLTRERYAYALIWPDGHSVLGERIDPIGGTTHGPFVVATLDKPAGRVAIASTVATTLVAYASASGLFAKQIDDTTPGRAMQAHAARQSDVHAVEGVVAWQQETPGGSEIRVNGAVVASGANVQLEDLAAGPGVTLIVWRDSAGLWGMQLPVETTPHPLPAKRAVWDGSGFVMFDSDAQIASNGSELLAVWNDGDVVAQQMSRDGAWIGPRIVVDHSALHKGTPHVRWDGAAWVVTWPEIVDATTAGFASMRIGGAKSYLAKAQMPVSLTDWSDAAPAVYYVRDGRLFMQRNDAARRRAAGR